jgi:hypothetical protein
MDLFRSVSEKFGQRLEAVLSRPLTNSMRYSYFTSEDVKKIYCWLGPANSVHGWNQQKLDSEGEHKSENVFMR